MVEYNMLDLELLANSNCTIHEKSELVSFVSLNLKSAFVNDYYKRDFVHYICIIIQVSLFTSWS